ncbi:hypothetical protein G5B37_12115 [Rasiella rasia]|uniref:Uncharacterized protein n=1 Tax=Rasiella rasia TaxID=2744027 RepID=A0A6G6GNZ8_9FLAO|nr:hypothetical protein [Rasiella rasia]QIE60279.1 hypothetical protein G5B37_12115 [Rasiella rasia]
MLKTTYKFCFISLALLLLTPMAFSQVGINTTNPEGILDVYNDPVPVPKYGLVLPRVSLTATNVMAPVTNPKAGVTAIPVGTTVFNTNVSATGTNDVTIGIYSWDGTQWIPQFNQEQSELFESDTFSLRSRSDTNLTVTGINGSSFTADYTGMYRIRVSVNYGGGGAKVPNEGSGGSRSDGRLNIARQSGTFTLTLGSDTYNFPVHSYSTSYDSRVGATNYFAIWQEFNSTFYKEYTENEVVNMTMIFDQDPATEFVDEGGNASFSSGRGYVAYDIPCTVEITYIGEQ